MTPRFRGTLAVSPYPDGRTWWLDRALTYVREGMTIKVPRGFETDYASVPRAFYALFPPWDTYGPAAVVHDWLYWSQPVPRAEADAIFREAMGVLEVPLWKRQTLYLAVRAFGQWAWDSNTSIGAQGYSRIRTPKSPPTPAWDRHYKGTTMTTPTAQDVVAAQLAAFNAAQAALDAAQDFAGVPRTSAHLADLQAQLDAANASITTLAADKAALQGKLDAVKTARQAEEAGEVAADAARKQIDAALA